MTIETVTYYYIHKNRDLIETDTVSMRGLKEIDLVTYEDFSIKAINSNKPSGTDHLVINSRNFDGYKSEGHDNSTQKDNNLIITYNKNRKGKVVFFSSVGNQVIIDIVRS